VGVIRDALLLVRAPLAATAIADGVTGYLLAGVHVILPDPRMYKPQAHVTLTHEPIDPKALALVALASTALYWAGMALNDFFDRERDKTLNARRPIPAGRVRPGTALALGLSLMVLGVAAAFGAGGPKAALVALGVAFSVLAYDGLLKRYRLPGSFAMACCRMANVFLGGAVALSATAGATAALHAPYAVAIGTYIFSLTLLSTFEDENAPPAVVFLGFGGVMLAPATLALLSPLPQAAAPLLALHLVLAAVLAGRAARRGTRATGHTTTRWLLRALLLLDAAALAGSGLWPWALAALALIVPNLVAAKLLFGGPPPAPAPSGGSAVV
jgi:4-hydroxybenzoate polyprenyltransferase